MAYHQESLAQINNYSPPVDSGKLMCMVNMPTTSTSFIMPSHPSPASLSSCGSGKIVAYFEDIDNGTGVGFDGVNSAQATNCVCEVIQYIESLIDLSKVSASDPIYIEFDQYSTTPAFLPLYLRATVVPNYQYNGGGYENSYMADAIINGGSNISTNHAGDIRINWAYENSFAFCNVGSSVGGCQEDFFQLILHEVTHIMGFSSAIEKSTGNNTLLSKLSGSKPTFTKFDDKFLYYKDGSGTLQKCVINAAPTLNLTLATIIYPQGGLWLNGDPLNTTRTNQPIQDVNDIAFDPISPSITVNPSYNHLVESFGERSWESPGFDVPYVMDWEIRPGYTIHEYSSPELKALIQLGYQPLNPNTYPWDIALNNTPPYTLGAIIDRSYPVITNTASPNYRGNGALIQATPAGNADFLIQTSNCKSVVIDLNAVTAGSIGRGTMGISGSTTTQPLHFQDDANQTLEVYQRKLWPITGCSYNKRTSNPLSISGNVITYTPPTNFIGRARFGFHLGDGIERGSFIVITIDVNQDGCFAHTPCEMVVNGDFEEGTEYNSYNFATSGYNMPAMVDQTSYMNNYVYNGVISNCAGGQVLTDGVEPLPLNVLPQRTIVDAYTPTFCYGPVQSYYSGAPFVWPLLGSRICGFLANPKPLPPATGTINNRYIYEDGNTTAGASNLTLNSELYPAASYRLEFDYNLQASGSTNFDLYFTNMFLGGPSFNYSSLPTNDAVLGLSATASTPNWNHQSSTFVYSPAATIGNKFLRINRIGGWFIDNVSLQRVITPLVKVAGNCGNVIFNASVPGGHIVNWQWYDAAGNAITGATSSIFTAAGYSSYTVVATDDNGCSGSSAPASLPDPCAKFTTDMGSRPVHYLSGVISSLPPAPGGAFNDRAFVLCGSVTVASNITFDHDFVLARPGVQMDVINGAKLTVIASHMATCPSTTDMWNGITLAGDGGRILVTGGSLIEDATTAISLPSGAGQSLGNTIIETDDAIFNRNNIGVSIQNFVSTHSQDFRFVKTIFTSRNLDQANDFKVWPTVPTLLTAALANAPYPPYALAAPNAHPFYDLLKCKDLSDALTGMYFNNASLTTNNYPGSYTYQSIHVGEDNNASLRNMFDNLRAGIEARNTSVTVRNSSFELMKNISKVGSYGAQGGIGVYSEAQAPNIKKLDVADGAQPWHNELYENRTGICSWHNYDLEVTGCKISSSNVYGADPIGTPNLVGQNGVEVNNYIDYKLLNISNNNIDAMLNGIVVANNVDWAKSGYTSQIRVTANQISLATMAGLAPNYKSQGILINNLTKYSGGPKSFGAPAWVLVQNNALVNAYNGISLNSFSSWTSVNNNSVNMQQADHNQIQYGIKTVNCNNQSVNNNTVTSNGISNDNARGIYTAASFAPNITCNTTSTVGRGFEFYSGVQIRANWLKNTMSNSSKGFVLNNSDIGPQPYAASVVTPAQGAANRWTTGTWAAGAYHTYTISSLPLNSELYILFGSTADLVPTLNSGTFIFSPWLYDPIAFTGIQSASSLFSGACSPATYASGSAPFFGPTKRLALRIAQDSVLYGRQEARNAWMAQYQLFRALSADTAYQNSDPILLAFYNTALGTRYDWLNQVEDSFATGNDAAALALMGMPPAPAYNVPGPNGVLLKDGAAGDTLIGNYIAYFQLYAHWRSGNFTSADSNALFALAQLCPHIDGAIIYEARALKQVITGDYSPYAADCNGGGGNAKMLHGATEQKYTLFPNPNDGSFELRQLMEGNQTAAVEIFDVLGAKVFSAFKSFENNGMHLNVSNLAPGFYYLILNDKIQGRIALSFIKQ